MHAQPSAYLELDTALRSRDLRRDGGRTRTPSAPRRRHLRSPRHAR